MTTALPSISHLRGHEWWSAARRIVGVRRSVSEKRKPSVNKGARPKGSGFRIVSDRPGEAWGSIAMAAEAIDVPKSSVRRAIRCGLTCAGRTLVRE